MDNYRATVIKTGNSYALRVPKQYVDANSLKLGQKVRLPEITPIKPFDHKAFVQAMKDLQAIPKEQSALKQIKDPVAWQRKIRGEWDRTLPGRD